MRREHDFYETAPWQVDALVDNLAELGGCIWCPCVGDGSIITRLNERRPDLNHFITNDLDRSRKAEFYGDATDPKHWAFMPSCAGGPPDWVVENPPFDAEILILKQAFAVARCGVAFMARVSFAEPTDKGPLVNGVRHPELARGPWLAEHPYQKRITLERYSFTGNGKSDSATTDWLIWAKVPIAGPFGVSAYGYKNRQDLREAA